MKVTIYIKPISFYVYLKQNKWRKYISKKGLEYKREIEDKLSENMIGENIKSGDCSVYIQFYHSDKRKNDIDNYVKPILDFMSSIVYKDDSQIISLNIRKYYDYKTPRIVIEVNDVKPGKVILY